MWIRVTLGLIVLLGAMLRLWHLERAGLGSLYYAPAVRTMAADWKLFFFVGYDPAGFVTLDKPPISFWIDSLSVRLFGLNSWAMCGPQIVAGLVSVGGLFVLVRRDFGTCAALLAALFLALAPINVAQDRGNLPDGWLALWLLWATLLVRRGTFGALLTAGGLIGIAFGTKMLAALIPMPILALVALLDPRVPIGPRIARLLAAGTVLFIIAAVWPVAVDTIPASKRPYVGGSQDNSVRDLIVGYNGLGRVSGRRDQFAESGPPPVRLAGSPGPGRLLRPGLADQALWLLPLSLVGAALGWRRKPTGVVLWGGWLLLHMVLFSGARGTFHPHYLVALGPPLAALAGVGVVCLVERFARGAPHNLPWLPLMLVVTAIWQVRLAHGVGAEKALVSWLWLTIGAALAALAVAAILAQPRAATIGGALGVVGLLGAPVWWSVVTVRNRGVGVLPLAGPLLETFPTMTIDLPADPRLVGFLQAHQEGARFAALVPSVAQASPLMLALGPRTAVMALGGFLGTDPILTSTTLQARIDRGDVRYAALPSVPDPSLGPNTALCEWLRANGKPVDPALWKTPDHPMTAYLVLYDLRARRPARRTSPR
jgi:4-amino-4-deoxy-L-arabinose transferase-like glycosyltransferase